VRKFSKSSLLEEIACNKKPHYRQNLEVGGKKPHRRPCKFPGKILSDSPAWNLMRNNGG
jgi:hypothetical protein